MTFARGILYWSPAQVRVWIRGSLLDLGSRSFKSACLVAEEFELHVVTPGDSSPSSDQPDLVEAGRRLKARSFI